MLDKFAQIITEYLHLPKEMVIDENTSFRDDLRADSFELMELVMKLEDEYGVRIADEDLSSFNTVGDVIDYVKAQGIMEE